MVASNVFVFVGLLLGESSRAFAPPLATTTGHNTWLALADNDDVSLLTSEQIRQRWDDNMAQLRAKDRQCPQLEPKNLQIEYEDDDIIVVHKPAGILCVPSEDGVHSLVETIATYLNNTTTTELSQNQMVIHRLGCATSGLILYAKSLAGMRGMHTLFRTRKVTRQYTALVMGHVATTTTIAHPATTTLSSSGFLQWPLMRCWAYPPYMRVATQDLQRHGLTLDASIVGPALLGAPKASLTHYDVLERGWLDDSDTDNGLPVTRLRLTSMTGRTHQLNVHCAALGHPIVGDTVYGVHGTAAPWGGLSTTTSTLSADVQRAIHQATVGKDMCIHSSRIRFQHPCSGQEMDFTSDPPF